MTNIEKHISILGHKVRDRVTEQEGVAVSVSFDLYGCVQVVVNPGLDKDGKKKDQSYFDIARLEVLSKEPVMNIPDFREGKQAEGRQGPAEKPPISN